MTGQDRPAFVMTIEAMAASFRVAPSEALLEGYWLGLSDLTLADVQRAVAGAIRDSQHMPRPVEIRRSCGEMDTATRAAIAWGSVRRTLCSVGVYTSVDFDDPIVNATVRNLGGWTRLGQKTDDEMDWTRKEFERVYLALASSGVSAELAEPLEGLHARSNAMTGFAPDPPKQISTGLPPHRKQLVRGVVPTGRLLGGETESLGAIAARLAAS